MTYETVSAILTYVNADNPLGMGGDGVFNRNAFRAKVVGAGMTLSSLAAEIGISPATLNRKMSGDSDFTRLEIQHIRMILRMTPEEADAIFFAQ